MSWFLVRVELHKCNEYEGLHAAMAAHGAGRTIIGDDGVEYQLPRATYWYECSWTKDALAVDEYFRSAVSDIWNRFEVIVTRTDSLAWSGLPQITRARVIG